MGPLLVEGSNSNRGKNLSKYSSQKTIWPRKAETFVRVSLDIVGLKLLK